MGSQQIMYRQDPTVLHDSPRLVQLWGFPTNNRQHQAWSPEMQQPALSKTPLFLVKIWKSGFPWKRSPQLPETSPYGFTKSWSSKSWSSHGWCKGEPWGSFFPHGKGPNFRDPPSMERPRIQKLNPMLDIQTPGRVWIKTPCLPLKERLMISW